MTGTENIIGTQATLGLIFSGVLHWLKTAKWLPFINQHSAGINHTILAATSAFGALGVHLAWNASGHSLTITGLDLATIAASLWLWARQWTVQFLIHRGIFGPVATVVVAPVANTLNAGGQQAAAGVLKQ